MDPTVSIPISRKQLEFRNANAWIRGFIGGRGSGKTKIGCMDVLLRAKDGEPYMGVSPSYVVLAETTWPTFRETAEEMGVWLRGTRSPVPKATFRTQDGGVASITFRTGEDPDSLRGPSRAGLWIDEACMQHEDVFIVGQAVLRHKRKMGWISITSTPKGKRHWTYGVFFEEKNGKQILRPDRAFVKADTRENPFLPDEFYDLIRANYSTTLAAQELGGEFVDMEGLMFKREWFGIPVKAVPADCERVRYWDKAGTKDGGDWSVGLLLARHESGVFYVEDVIRGQWSPYERNQIMQQTAEADAAKYNGEVLIFVEQEPGSGGKESMMTTVRELAGHPVRRHLVSGGKAIRTVGAEKFPGQAKITRAQGFAAQCEAGNVRLLRGRWNAEYLDELSAFPEYAYADQVDASSGAFNNLIKYCVSVGVPPSKETIEEESPERYGIHTEKTAPYGRFNRPGQFVR